MVTARSAEAALGRRAPWGGLPALAGERRRRDRVWRWPDVQPAIADKEPKGGGALGALAAATAALSLCSANQVNSPSLWILQSTARSSTERIWIIGWLQLASDKGKGERCVGGG